jgi:UDP-N-acetylglucosamine 2-epimerase (non-hydrolysing)
MRKLKIFLIAAARPNFMKISPLYHALNAESWALPQIIHTGQHYDISMSDSFIRDLGIPEPYTNLGVGSGTHAEQTGKVMIEFENVALEERPDLTVVVGDVNSTMACTLVAVKLGLKVAHLEAGLRSFDRTMPEEINRIVTDSLADILWTPSPDADENLLKEGVGANKIRRVGNIMIDSFELLRTKIEKSKAFETLSLKPREFAIVTLHRPSNVDVRRILGKICETLLTVAGNIKVIFPIHPRTRKNLEEFDLFSILKNNDRLLITEPLNYVSFMNLVLNAKFVITDSGGIQEETTYLGIPCLTLRKNTERPITIEQGTNSLCNLENIRSLIDRIIQGNSPEGRVPDLWDGQTAKRVIADIEESFL